MSRREKIRLESVEPPTSPAPRRPRVCFVDQIKAAACIRSSLVCRMLLPSPFPFSFRIHSGFSKCMLACPISCEKKVHEFFAAKRSSDVLMQACNAASLGHNLDLSEQSNQHASFLHLVLCDFN
jgi:hypothetical protein